MDKGKQESVSGGLKVDPCQCQEIEWSTTSQASICLDGILVPASTRTDTCCINHNVQTEIGAYVTAVSVKLSETAGSYVPHG